MLTHGQVEGKSVEVPDGPHLLAARVDDVNDGLRVLVVVAPMAHHLTHRGDVGTHAAFKGEGQRQGSLEEGQRVIQQLRVEIDGAQVVVRHAVARESRDLLHVVVSSSEDLGVEGD